MSRQVKGAPGHFGVTLPGGWVLDPDDVVIISDAEWSRVLQAGLDQYLIDQGPTTAVPPRAPSFRDIQRAALGGGVGTPGAPGADGRSIISVVLIAGSHAPGTLDTYQINYSYGSPSTFQVYNGADGAPGAAGATGPPGPPGTSPVFVSETPTGTIDAFNQTFFTTQPFVAGTTRLYLNGLRQNYSTSYTESGTTQLNLTFAPHPGDELTVDYQKA